MNVTQSYFMGVGIIATGITAPLIAYTLWDCIGRPFAHSIVRKCWNTKDRLSHRFDAALIEDSEVADLEAIWSMQSPWKAL